MRLKWIVLSLVTALVVGGGITLYSLAEDNLFSSKGRIESVDVLFDSSDFDVLEHAYEVGKQESYQKGYDAGYAEGFANQPATTTNVIYTYHKHDTGDGVTEVSFTAEEVEYGAKDVWFTQNKSPDKMSTAIGCYTKQATRQERYQSGWQHHHDPVRNSPSDHWYKSESGSMEWTGSWNDWDEPIYSYRTVNDGFVPNCGHAEGELIRITVNIN